MKLIHIVQCDVCGKKVKRFLLRRKRMGEYTLCKQCKKELKTSGVVCFDEEEEKGED